MKKMLKTKTIRVLISGLMFVVLAAASGCGSFELKPWVKPYERAHLADPIMALSRDAVDESYMAHVYEAREAMRGADGGAGGGCGCN